MKAHLAKIFNFTCDRNPNHWWSVDGIEPLRGQVLFCPHCGHRNIVEEIVDHTVTLPSVDAEVDEQSLSDLQNMIKDLNKKSADLRSHLKPEHPSIENALGLLDGMIEALNLEGAPERIANENSVDIADLQDAIAARDEAQRESTIPWEQLKEQLALNDSDEVQ